MTRVGRWMMLLLLVGTVGLSAIQPAEGRAAGVQPPSSTPATPSPTPLERCGAGYCLVLTPSAAGAAGPASPTPVVGRAPTTITVHCDLIAPSSWVPCLIAAAVDLVNGWINGIIDTLSALDIWSQTPSTLTYDNPAVKEYWTTISSVADALLVLIIAGVALDILLCARAGQTYSGALERFWRVLLVFAWVTASWGVIKQAIDLSNGALTLLDAAQEQPLYDRWAQADPAEAALLMGLLALVDGAMEILLSVCMIMRIALLDVLIVLAPLGLLCYAWPRLQHWGQLWSRLFVATLITQFVQIAALRLGEDLFVRGPDLVITGESSGAHDARLILQFLIASGVFVVVLRLPRLIRNHAGHAATPVAMALWAARAFAVLPASPPLGRSTAAVSAVTTAPAAVAAPPPLPPAGSTGGRP